MPINVSPARPIRPGDGARFAVATVVVAILDISFAGTWWVVIRHATTFTRVLQSIASGFLGRAAFDGGARTAVLGAGLHCIVAAGWTGLFILLVRRSVSLSRVLREPWGAVRTGMPYGICVWLAMDLVVVPLSHATPAPVTATWFWVSLVWHAVGVGLPIALVARS